MIGTEVVVVVLDGDSAVFVGGSVFKALLLFPLIEVVVDGLEDDLLLLLKLNPLTFGKMIKEEDDDNNDNNTIVNNIIKLNSCIMLLLLGVSKQEPP